VQPAANAALCCGACLDWSVVALVLCSMGLHESSVTTPRHVGALCVPAALTKHSLLLLGSARHHWQWFERCCVYGLHVGVVQHLVMCLVVLWAQHVPWRRSLSASVSMCERPACGHIDAVCVFLHLNSAVTLRLLCHCLQQMLVSGGCLCYFGQASG
jgi:hypothetical protein